MLIQSLRSALAGLVLGSFPMVAMADTHTVTNGDATIGYSVRWKGPLILFLASTGRGTAEFGPLADMLAEHGFRVALPEPRGIGDSKGPMEGVSFHDFGDDYAKVIKAEGGPAIVAGHAFSNWIARTMAHDHPDLVRGVVLVAASAKTWPKKLTDAVVRINDPAATEEQRLDALRLAFFAKDSDPTPWLEGWYPAVTASQRDALKLTERDAYLSGATVPMLDLQGRLDPFRPAESRNEVRDEYGDSVTVKVIDGASHALPAEKPQETADAIAEWADALP